MRSVLLVGLVAAVALVKVGSAQWGNYASCMNRWYFYDPCKLEHNLGEVACKYSKGVKDCQWKFNGDRGMGGDNSRHKGRDYIYTCKDDRKKYIFVEDEGRKIRCFDKNVSIYKGSNQFGITENAGKWTVEWDQKNSCSNQKVKNCKAYTCNGDKVVYG